MSQDPQKVIVYRSERERIADEFWWSEGYITPTMAGDAFLILLVIGVITILWAKFKTFKRRRFQ